MKYIKYTICPADNATAGSLGRRRAGQLRFEFVAVSAGHIVYPSGAGARASASPSSQAILYGETVNLKKCCFSEIPKNYSDGLLKFEQRQLTQPTRQVIIQIFGARQMESKVKQS
jgi:hypothetical protein